MAILSYNEIIPKKVILYNDEPYLVLSSHVFRKQQRKPVNITKLKGLISGRVVENTFHQNENAEEAELEKRTITYIYESKGEYWFHTAVEALLFNDEIIGVSVPIKVELKVTEAMPAVKGNTSSGALKEVTLETGAKLMVPMFIGEGDVVAINTETSSYSERVSKA